MTTDAEQLDHFPNLCHKQQHPENGSLREAASARHDIGSVMAELDLLGPAN
jgi:hypothetical protein